MYEYQFIKNKKGKNHLWRLFNTYINKNSDIVFQYEKEKRNYFIDSENNEKIYIEKN